VASKSQSSTPERGWFITFEGGEGTGKSTQVNMLADRLAADGFRVLATREPGGSPGAEAVRHVLLSGSAEPLGPEMEAILFAAARSDHVENLIRPALLAGTTVLCDRFYDSTRVYQGSAGAVSREMLSRLEDVACEECWPDISLFLDLDPEIGVARASARRAGEDVPDRFERQAMEKHRNWREAYLRIASEEPDRCAVVDASGTAKQVHDRILKEVRERMARLKPGWLNRRRAQAEA
jgi:dTMP kinase